MSFSVEFKTRWADFDANIHMRHTAYNDYAAELRLRFFKEHNITVKDFTKESVGPILFEENTKFLREVHMGTDISVNLKVIGLSNKGERWKIQHEVFNEAGKLAAVIKVYGAWIDLTKRKLTAPPKEAFPMFEKAERTAALWEQAKQTCTQNDMRLPEPYEWKLSCDNAGTWSLTSMTGNWEWASNEALPMYYGGYGVGAAMFGNSGCRYASWGWLGYDNGTESTQTFRCVR